METKAETWDIGHGLGHRWRLHSAWIWHVAACQGAPHNRKYVVDAHLCLFRGKGTPVPRSRLRVCVHYWVLIFHWYTGKAFQDPPQYGSGILNLDSTHVSGRLPPIDLLNFWEGLNGSESGPITGWLAVWLVITLGKSASILLKSQTGMHTAT